MLFHHHPTARAASAASKNGGGAPGTQNPKKSQADAHVLQTSANLPRTVTKSRPHGGTGYQNVLQRSLLGTPTDTFPRKFVIVAPSQNHCIYYVFVTLNRLWLVCLVLEGG